MKRTIRIPRLFRRSRAFLADAKGLAAIELALILPIALMLMSLVVFGGQAYSVQRKVTLAATTVANIFAQANNVNTSTITVAEKNQILAYPNLILYPYDGSTASVVVSQLLVNHVERDRDRHGLRQLAECERNSAHDGPTNLPRSIDRIRLFRLGRQ
jgi:Flp pilus assembly protein TadG